MSREHATVRWLDAQPPGSVLYVALVSEVPLRTDQVHELALGLELAGARFLWALRKPSGATAAAADEDMLPPSLSDRTDGQGLVTTGWVPQVSVLTHDAVGGFLTHCSGGVDPLGGVGMDDIKVEDGILEAAGGREHLVLLLAKVQPGAGDALPRDHPPDVLHLQPYMTL